MKSTSVRILSLLAIIIALSLVAITLWPSQPTPSTPSPVLPATTAPVTTAPSPAATTIQTPATKPVTPDYELFDPRTNTLIRFNIPGAKPGKFKLVPANTIIPMDIHILLNGFPGQPGITLVGISRTWIVFFTPEPFESKPEPPAPDLTPIQITIPGASQAQFTVSDSFLSAAGKDSFKSSDGKPLLPPVQSIAIKLNLTNDVRSTCVTFIGPIDPSTPADQFAQTFVQSIQSIEFKPPVISSTQPTK